jgi:hypothetical protein
MNELSLVVGSGDMYKRGRRIKMFYILGLNRFLINKGFRQTSGQVRERNRDSKPLMGGWLRRSRLQNGNSFRKSHRKIPSQSENRVKSIRST